MGCSSFFFEDTAFVPLIAVLPRKRTAAQATGRESIRAELRAFVRSSRLNRFGNHFP
jgi:hypothetical protein